MSIAAVATGASALDANWTLASLKCTKPGLQGGPNVVDLAKVIRPDGATFSSLSLLEVTEAIAPIVESRGNASGVSLFAAMAAAVTEADSSLGTAAYKAAAGPRSMLLWGLEALRGMLHEKGAKVFLPGPPAPAVAAPGSSAPVAAAPGADASPAAAAAEQQGLPSSPAAPAEAQGGASAEAAAQPVVRANLPATANRPGDDQEDEVVTTRVVAPTQAQRALAVDVIQRAENQKLVGLIQDSDISREVNFGCLHFISIHRCAFVRASALNLSGYNRFHIFSVTFFFPSFSDASNILVRSNAVLEKRDRFLYSYHKCCFTDCLYSTAVPATPPCLY